MNPAAFVIFRSSDRLSRPKSVWRRFCLIVNALGIVLCVSLFSVPSPAHADLTEQGPITGRSVTHGHVFLYTSQGPADVSRMLYSVDGQTYVAEDTGGLLIYIDYVGGGVFDSSGMFIGFVDLS